MFIYIINQPTHRLSAVLLPKDERGIFKKNPNVYPQYIADINKSCLN